MMDAEHMDFPDDAFDRVVAMYVATVVPDPARLVSEMRRVCRAGGEIYVLNHFHSTNPLLKRLERLLAPLSRVLGFRTDYSLENFVRETGLQVAETRRVNLFGYWTLLRMRNDKCADSQRGAAGTSAGAAIEGRSAVQPLDGQDTVSAAMDPGYSYGQRDREPGHGG